MTQAPAISLAITDPAPGTTIHADRVTVRGMVQGPTNTGISVNGVTAVVNAGIFAAEDVPLTPGQNVLSATAAIPAGDVVTVAVTVSSDGGPPMVELDATPRAGLAPLTVTFTYGLATSASVQSLSIDFDGNGVSDFTTTDPAATLETTYTVPGLYTARLTLTMAGGSVLEGSVPVAVQNEAVVVGLLKDAWSSMTAALAAGNTDGALASFDEFGQSTFERVFADLGASLPSILASLSSLEVMQVGENLAESWVLKQSGAVQKLFFIYFLRGPDGVWRIHSM